MNDRLYQVEVLPWLEQIAVELFCPTLIINMSVGEISYVISFSQNKQFVKISGKVNEHVKDNVLTFAASTPPDRRTSFSGSGLPFPNAAIAFGHSPNMGSIKLGHGNVFSIEMQTPNSYYIGLGTLLIPPTIYFSYHNGYTTKQHRIKLFNGIPYRTLTYPGQRTSTSFYPSILGLPVRGQEEILRSSAYPCDTMREYEKFWGERPPV